VTSRGIVRLLNTSRGGVLCLAGEVDSAAVASFVARYGREPARVAAIDAGSVTALSPSGVELLLDHLEVAARAGRPVALRRSPVVARLLTAAGAGVLARSAEG
jgi:anti-anti-sigma regulatory factor